MRFLQSTPDRPFAVVFIVVLLALLISPFVDARQGVSVQALRFIGEQQIPHKYLFQETTVGGISGIDYDAATDTWILASDDRSDFDPSRFYTARLSYNEHSFESVALTAVTSFRRADGEFYSNRHLDGETADVEAIRFDPLDSSLWYVSEGDGKQNMNPFIRRASRKGDFLESLPIAAMFAFQPEQQMGPRNNLTFEGLTFALDGQSLWVAMEGPLWQDGAVPTPTEGAMVRITQYSRDGKTLRQVAYPIDVIPIAPAVGKFADNGVVELLAVDDERFLIIERAAVQNAAGQFSNFIRLYEIDMSNATDVSGLGSLVAADFQPVSKRLVLDLTTLPLAKLDNIEGISWGPKLANGNNSLVMVSDDNFNASQVTQLLVFEVFLQKL